MKISADRGGGRVGFLAYEAPKYIGLCCFHDLSADLTMSKVRSIHVVDHINIVAAGVRWEQKEMYSWP